MGNVSKKQQPKATNGSKMQQETTAPEADPLTKMHTSSVIMHVLLNKLISNSKCIFFIMTFSREIVI